MRAREQPKKSAQERVAAVRYEVGELRHRGLDRYGLCDVRRDLGGHHRTRVDGRVRRLGAERQLQHFAVRLRDHRLRDDGRGRDGERRLLREQRGLRLEQGLLRREQGLLREQCRLLREQGGLLGEQRCLLLLLLLWELRYGQRGGHQLVIGPGHRAHRPGQCRVIRAAAVHHGQGVRLENRLETQHRPGRGDDRCGQRRVRVQQPVDGQLLQLFGAHGRYLLRYLLMDVLRGRVVRHPVRFLRPQPVALVHLRDVKVRAHVRQVQAVEERLGRARMRFVVVVVVVVAVFQLEMQFRSRLVQPRVELVQRLAGNELVDLHRRQRLDRRHQSGHFVRLYQGDAAGVGASDHRQDVRFQHQFGGAETLGHRFQRRRGLVGRQRYRRQRGHAGVDRLFATVQVGRLAGQYVFGQWFHSGRYRGFGLIYQALLDRRSHCYESGVLHRTDLRKKKNSLEYIFHLYINYIITH